jgi:predicted nucleic acid-binding protein
VASRVDANIIVRYLTGDPPAQAERVGRLLNRVAAGELEILVEDVVLAEVVWVGASFYQLSRENIVRPLLEFLAHPGVRALDKPALQLALGLYQQQSIDFTDALLAAKALLIGDHDIYSFDRDFDRIPGIRRLEPT